MITTQHLPYLDGWRGLAITFLLIGHFFPFPGIVFGTFGVNLFFVLSGLLMARLLFEQNVPIETFYRRRLSRVLPALFALIGLLVLGYLVAGRKVDWLDVAAAATLTNNYIEGTTGPWRMPLGHIWSLCVEEHSYILLAVIAVIGRRKLGDVRWLVGAITVVTACFGIYYFLAVPHSALLRLNLHTEVAAFGIFASATLFLIIRGRRVPNLPGVLFGLLFGFALAMHWWSIPAPVRTIAGVSVLALAVNLLAVAPGWLHAALSFAPLRQLGLWSFSLYVWQQPFYMYFNYYGMSRVLAFALAIASGITSFYLIERPCRTWLNKRWAGESAAPAAAASVFV